MFFGNASSLVEVAPPSGMSPLTALLLVLAGIVLMLIGRTLLRVVVGAGFGLLLAYWTFDLAIRLGLGRTAALVAALVFFLVGFVVGWFIFKLSLSIVASLALSFAIAPAAGLSGIYLFLLIILLTVVFYMIMNYLLAIVAFVAGAVLVYYGSYWLLHSAIMSAAVTLVLALICAIYKLRRL